MKVVSWREFAARRALEEALWEHYWGRDRLRRRWTLRAIALVEEMYGDEERERRDKRQAKGQAGKPKGGGGRKVLSLFGGGG